MKRRPANFQCLFDLAPAAAHTIPRIIFHNNRRYYSRGRLSSRPRGFALLFLFLLPLFSLLSSAPVARAACFNPAGVAGDTIYNAAYRVMQYCNGGAWAGIGHVSNLTGGLVGWWKLDDGAGTSAGDSSGNGNTGTLTGSPLPAWTTSGMNNGALNFAGGATTNYVGVPSNSVLSGMATLTVAAWIYVDGTATGGSVIDKRHTGTPDWNSYYVVIDLTNFRYGPTVTNASGTASTFTASAVGSLVLNTWQHVVMVYDGANVQMYINGAASGTPELFPSVIGVRLDCFHIDESDEAVIGGCAKINRFRASRQRRFVRQRRKSRFRVRQQCFGNTEFVMRFIHRAKR